MVATVKLRKQGGSLAVTLPKEVVRELGVRAGEMLHLVQVARPGQSSQDQDRTTTRVHSGAE